MVKITPNPPENPSVSPYDSLDSSKLHEAAERALDYHLPPFTQPPKLDTRPGKMFVVIPDVDNETLLAHASETLASVNVLASDLAFELEGSRRHVALAIQQMVVLGELLVNRALDNFDPYDSNA
ncbi:hypothetical protein C1Y08_28345 [Pseudomonas sp. FW306-02-F02-AA]|uniref:DUF3077 domain-containing protein n=2 Tax=Pseudomonas TaxID=286 RepID=A0A0N9WKQ6_PSEFL|nr:MULTISPECIES: DUF6124 family protein [Pseudomonas]PMZ06623.1 hypothetical protein C1Y06_28720 [Pseudomonas sp. FW306-02-H06C]PMZ30918.1 hypothetical protein C1X99_28890 [Pseudomonas sp. FW306-02-H06B]ALI03179.1 hypothetical protein AO353_19610 [Pseudomonas fluorescens]PMZ00770.1 hypothetical protein C1Y07_28495 [Pseudomonas sp. FW306-02-F02-AB]PMZ12552.1 hypothetical protein C1Y08_28345 [Pseudomonas sp. FW306-02-F02-AA]